MYGARVIELAVDQEKAPVESVPPRLSGRLYRISGCGRAGVALLGVEGATPVRERLAGLGVSSSSGSDGRHVARAVDDVVAGA